MDDRKNLPDYESLTRRVRATPQNQFAEFTEKKLLYHAKDAVRRSVKCESCVGSVAISHKHSMKGYFNQQQLLGIGGAGRHSPPHHASKVERLDYILAIT